MSDKSKKPEEKKHELREISDEELEIILAEHEKWLETRGKEGKRADLSRANLAYNFLEGANLQQANLIMADLQGADLSGANLQEADLYQANLPEADLHRANIQMAKLYDANLQDAILVRADLRAASLDSANLQGAELLQADVTGAFLTRADLSSADLSDTKGIHLAHLDDCNLVGATGLKGDEFARANVTGSKLPEDIAKWKVLEVVTETSKNARKIFLAMLLACVYSWLTIGSTTDVNLLTNSASSPLPIIGTAIPIAWFYFAAPLLLVGLYFYQHFYLQRLWENLAGLPAIFEDGKRLDQRAYPWLLNGLVRRHFDKLQGKRAPLQIPKKRITILPLWCVVAWAFLLRKLRFKRAPLQVLEEWITVFLAWWVVPLTLLWFWARYLPRHDWGGTCLQVGASLVAIAVGFAFYTTHARTLRGEVRPKLTWKTAWKDTRIWRTLGSLAFGTGLIGLSFGAINGVRPYQPPYPGELYIRVPRYFRQVGYDVFADLHEATASTRPVNYWELDPKVRDSSVTGAYLAGSDLRWSNLNGAFLAKADLSFADLQGAEAYEANLRGASMVEAGMDSANFAGTNLRGANMLGANLAGTSLWRAELAGASLWGVILCGTYLAEANLQGAQLGDADLSGAVLFDSSFDPPLSVRGLTQEQLDEACGDSLTQLPPGFTIKPCWREDSTGTATDSGP